MLFLLISLVLRVRSRALFKKKRARPLDDERAEGNDEIYLSGFDETGSNLMPAYTIGLGVDSPPNNYFDFDCIFLLYFRN